MRSIFVFLLIAGASTIVAFGVLMFFFMRYWGLDSVEGAPPDTFPVLVSQPGPTCAVVLWREIEAAKDGAAEWSYLAPMPELAECKALLGPDATLRVRPAEGGRQHITLTSSPGGDEVNESRYFAASDTIEPISHQRYFGPAISLVAAGESVLFGGVTGASGAWFFRRRRSSTA